MKKLLFLIQYILNPRSVGAIFPSSNRLAHKMIRNVQFKDAKCLVEYGAGTGVFTDYIIKNKREDTIFIVLEINKSFYDVLKEKYKNEKNVYVIDESAERIDQILKEFKIKYIDSVISGLPFGSLPQEISSTILNKTKKLLKKNGNFITFQYSTFKVNFIKEYFKNINIKKEIVNIPPAYVLVCKNNL